MIEEHWVLIDDFPRYAVSSYGRIKNTVRLNSRKISLNNSGFPIIVLFGEDRKTRYVRHINRLVANAFLPKPTYEDENQVWHRDGDLLNCHVDNLKWDTRPRVIEWNRMHREQKPKYNTPLVRSSKTDKTYRNAFDCAMDEGVLESTVIWFIEGLADQFDPTARYSYVKDW